MDDTNVKSLEELARELINHRISEAVDEMGRRTVALKALQLPDTRLAIRARVGIYATA
jgi:hypothetical protein